MIRLNKFLTAAVLLLSVAAAHSQIRLDGYNSANIDPVFYSQAWPARWISAAGEPADVYGVYHFRKSFQLDTVPEKFIIHVSADNRYKLFVNGTRVSQGPVRGDVRNWNFETVDIAPFLRKGGNLIAAVVWNYADLRPMADISFGETGLLVQGNGPTEQSINTDSSWLAIRNDAYYPSQSAVYGYYVCGPGERVDAALYPWGWETEDHDDSAWQNAREGLYAAMKGGMDYPGRMLVPSPIPPMELKEQRFESVRFAEGVEIPAGFPSLNGRLTIPAHTKVRLVLDQETLTTGYLTLISSGGEGAEITIGYAEAYYVSPWSMEKGNRNDIEGKVFAGYADSFVCDGKENRSYTSLWWRTWRYVEIQIETLAEPLIIEDVFSTFSAYPLVRETQFEAPGRKQLTEMLDIGWRTARLCAHDTYMDCPYYEQLQYFGDTRIQSMITLYNTRDPYLVKHAIEQGRRSMDADGITMSRYPTDGHQFIPPFSLFWIAMGYDYWMMRGDEGYMRTLLPAYRSILSWFEERLKTDGSLERLPYWFFIDWAEGFERGSAPCEETGDSALQDLMFLIALDNCTRMERSFGIPGLADHYSSVAETIKANFDKKYWNADRGLYADTGSHGSFSQHTNSLAVLAGIINGPDAYELMGRTLEEDLIQATVYFRYYLNMALNKAGWGGDILTDNLQVWEEQMNLGLTTWAECPEPTRSDCHAWGASLNVEFFRTLFGISPSSPGFRTVRIEPYLGSLKEVLGSMPHPDGTISVSYRKDRTGSLTAELSLPANISGEFIYNGKTYPLVGGKQILRAE